MLSIVLSKGVRGVIAFYSGKDSLCNCIHEPVGAQKKNMYISVPVIYGFQSAFCKKYP